MKKKLNNYINKVIQGDCVEVMKEMPSNSVDTIITDPPYGLEFMGKDWDKLGGGIEKTSTSAGGFSRRGKEKGDNPYANTRIRYGKDMSGIQKFHYEWAKEALRIAKPGATMLCFGGSRTFHRIASGIEDAGWQIKDTLMWLYGSGFPKSLNIGKAIDKKLGNKRKVVGKKKTPSGQNYPEGYDKNSEIFDRASAVLTNGNTEWEGYGTALKPAYEPIILAMKPKEGTYANNALKWGVAGLNIDGGRIGTETEIHTNGKRSMYGGNSLLKSKTYNDKTEKRSYGRFPANLLLDEESAEMLDKQSGESKSSGGRIGKKNKSLIDFGLSGKYQKGDPGFGDTGGASRFFYVAKAGKKERNAGCEDLENVDGCHYGQDEWSRKNMGNKPDIERKPVKNNHPTVKPLKLMEYLCILTKTPTGGIVLDPFMGSGTTGLACQNTGRDFIGIEKEPEYVKIAEARLKFNSRQQSLDNYEKQ